MEDFVHGLRFIFELVAAVGAAYAAYRSRRNMTLNKEVIAKVDAAPARVVTEIQKANGPLSDSLCRAKHLLEQLMPGESKPAKATPPQPPE